MRGRKILWRTVGGLAALLCAWMASERVKYEWDDWAALAVQHFKGPLLVNVVNGTDADIPVLAVGIAGHECQMGCLHPGDRRTCRLRFGQYSQLRLERGNEYRGFPTFIPGPPTMLPVFVTWRSHGAIDVVLTDAGIETRGAYSEEL